jgi:hypothetical protein
MLLVKLDEDGYNSEDWIEASIGLKRRPYPSHCCTAYDLNNFIEVNK